MADWGTYKRWNGVRTGCFRITAAFQKVQIHTFHTVRLKKEMAKPFMTCNNLPRIQNAHNCGAEYNYICFCSGCNTKKKNIRVKYPDEPP